jgi:hypothetical protein
MRAVSTEALFRAAACARIEPSFWTDLRAMALVTAAISAERLAPSGERVARAIGAAR